MILELGYGWLRLSTEDISVLIGVDELVARKLGLIVNG